MDGPTGRAWADYFLDNHRPLTAYALSLTGNLPDAQDLIQDVLVRLVRQDRPACNATPFVLRCLRNLAIDRRRAARAGPPTTGLDGPSAAFIDTRVDDPDRREDAECIKAALDDLPPDRREVIVLKIFAGMTFREIAGILDRPLGTVTSHYARGLDDLRAACNRELKHAI